MANSYDPGPCKNETHGKYVLVKNRADEEIVVICVKDKGIYHWKSMDGKMPITICIYSIYSISFLSLVKMPLRIWKPFKSSIPALRIIYFIHEFNEPISASLINENFTW